MTVAHLVVVGASLAGLRAVEAARKVGYPGKITLIGSESHLPYDRPPLSKAFLDELAHGELPAPTEFRTQQVFSDELDVQLVLGSAATALDTDHNTVAVGDRSIDYDALIIATGADARRLPGTENLAGVHTLRTLDDALAVRRALDNNARVAVIGAGFIGSEVASSARKRGLAPVVIEALPTPLVRAVGAQMGEILASLHSKNGTELRCGIGVERLDGDKKVERVVLSDGTEIPVDLVVVGIGASPAVTWLNNSGLHLDNGVVCDATLFTGVDGVYAAGDIARWHNPAFDRHMRLEHWTSAAEQGATAAKNALDPVNAKPYSTIPYFWSDWYDSRIQFVGTPTADEVLVVDGDIDADGRVTALYRAGDHLVGALTVNGQTEIMKYRNLIAKSSPWSAALDFAAKRKAIRRTQ